jgi:asparagine synthase (glutamine-hydrolysing)
MCGIAGIVDLAGQRPPTRSELAAMARQLSHRGPDGDGFYCRDAIGLAHTRLSIIDLAGGAQPIHNEDQTVWVVFNGEIFNYIELRAELEQQGHRFYTHSDTEVIVHLYEQHGDDFASFLNGQFAIGLWDSLRQRLVLVRDRVGIAPLYYCKQDCKPAGGTRLLFASEVKAILPALGQAPRLNADALDQIFTFWSTVSPATMFEGVRELSPGMRLVVDRNGEHLSRYWDWQFPFEREPTTKNEYASGSEAQLCEELHQLLIDATQIRLRADVPVGAYLSGGLDSSILTSLIHHHSDAPLRTFSIGFDEGSLDESSFQQMMIDHLGADHSRIQCSNADVANGFMKTVWHTESTILRTAPVPMRLLSGLVRSQNYKVVLTGEGADEVFGGYDIFKEAKIRQFWARNTQSAWRPLLLKRLYPYLDISPGRAQSYVQNFFGIGLDNPDVPWFAHLPRWDTTAKAKQFFSDNLRSQLSATALDRLQASLPQAIGNWSPFARAQYIEAKMLMGGYLLTSQGDRMLMASSVEGRFPFLDHRVIEFANRLPAKLKMKVLSEKYLLRKTMARYLPNAIVNRHKQPYRAPDAPAFFATAAGQAPEFVDEMLSEAKLAQYGYFDPKKVSLLLRKARRGDAIGAKDNQAVVGILSTQVWHHLFIENFYNQFAPMSAA